jgi:D-glycero-D-manno-heptose 1,7-bisphosphate phosphatase
MFIRIPKSELNSIAARIPDDPDKSGPNFDAKNGGGMFFSLNRAVFLDRDGVLLKDRPDYVKSVAEAEVVSGAAKSISALRKARFRLIVVTNQSVVNRGLLPEHTLKMINAKLVREYARQGVQFDGVYYCPHRPDQRCACRKPAPGLLLTAARIHGLDLGRSWMIGDRATDLQAGRAAGCKVLRVRRNDSSSLDRAVHRILSNESLSTDRQALILGA